MRILLGPVEIAGYYTNLLEGFRRLGICSDYLKRKPHPFNYDGIAEEKKGLIVQIWKWACQQRANTPRTKITRKIIFVLLDNLFSSLLVIKIALTYDVLILGFGQTYTNRVWEIALYKLMRKKMIFTFHGSDCRPPFIDGGLCNTEKEIDYRTLYKWTQKRKKSISHIEQYADFIINAIPQAHFHTKPFINGLILGLPNNFKNESIDAAKIHNTKNNVKRVRILHSPSDERAKGTKEILSTIDSLRKKGHPIDLIIIKNMPNSKVITELRKSDFIIDQLYSDNPMAGFATEAAHCGKPAVVGGYYAEMIRDHYAERDIPPSLFVHPDKIEEAIERLIVDDVFRLDLGKRAYNFVRSRWMPEQVASRYLQLIKGNIPEPWWFSPENIQYVSGAGMSELQTKEIIKNFVSRYGVKSLHLSDKPDLERKFLEFSKRDQ
jgi:glycosyltransferase involved in cell wall biosynthesis